MTIKPELTEYIRTLVRGDHEANNRIEAQLDTDGWDGFPRFMAALFFLTIDSRFGETATSEDVIKFVAELRADLSHGGPDIKAEAAEALIRSIIDPSTDYTIDPDMIGKIQAATIYKVLTEQHLRDADLDSVLAEATQLANRS